MMKEKHVIKNSNTRYQISKQKLVLIIWVDIYTTEKCLKLKSQVSKKCIIVWMKPIFIWNIWSVRIIN